MITVLNALIIAKLVPIITLKNKCIYCSGLCMWG